MASQFNLQNATKNYPFMACVLKVNARSSWQNPVRKVLKKCHGIHSFRMDDSGLVEISGTVDPDILLKMLDKAGKKAVMLWCQFGECSSNLFMTTSNNGGRYLQPNNLSWAELPSYEALRLSDRNKKHRSQIAYDHRHDNDLYAPLHRNQQYQLAYDHNQDYRQGYGYGYRHDHQSYDHGYYHQYNYGHKCDLKQTRSHLALPLPDVKGPPPDICCRVM